MICFSPLDGVLFSSTLSTPYARPRWLRRLSAAAAEKRRAARDDTALIARRRSRVIFFCSRPFRDHPLNNIFLQLQQICSAAAESTEPAQNVHGAPDLLLRHRHLQQARPGRKARPTAHMHRHHRRSRLAARLQSSRLSFPSAGASPGQHAAFRSRGAAGGPAAGQG